MNLFLPLTLSVSLLSSVSFLCSAQLFCDTSSSAKFSQDSTSKPICVVFHGLESDNRTLFYFSTKVDEYTLVGLVNSMLDDTSRWNDEVKIQIEVGGKQSKNRTVVQDGNWAVEQIGIVIIVDEGKIDEIEWDDGCFSCTGSDKKCLDNKACGTLIDKCDENDTGHCDLSIFVSWYGTDKDGDYLLSAGQRISQFQSTTAEDYVDSVSKESDSISSSINFG